ncbi:tyrosine-type recombinase/integrase [Kordiimonas lacus]|uniref:Site-specific recombinase XerD n=1 Tax=Kordiimonas lacus TaxID=637679 RepID=A0A1G7BLP0_9PROT|nr:site-specific integrase [Kordiimonas lacus]SDE27386.1 Site-specific recombinase XerD [Kordiimonas lacus]
MASIRKRVNGDGSHSWHVQVRKKGFPSQTASFDRKIDADRWATQVEADMDARRWRDTSGAEATSLKDALTRYEAEYTTKKKGAPAEARRIARWKQEKIAGYSLSKLKGSDFARYRDGRLSEGRSPSTVRLELAIISHLFNMARREWGYEGLNNPIQDIKMPGHSKARDRRLGKGEEAVLLEYCQKRENAWIYPITVFAIETAARRGEILGLQWSDVNLAAKTALLRDTKNGDDREIPLSERAVLLLKGLEAQGRGSVFCTTENSFRLSWARMMRQIIKKNPEFNGFRFHDLRHEATSRFFEKGFGIMEVAAITGHKDLKMLQRYTHLKASDLAQRL